MLEYLRPAAQPAIDVNAHYYFFSAVLVVVTTAGSILSALALAVAARLSGRIDWADARINDLARHMTADEAATFRRLAADPARRHQYRAEIERVTVARVDKDFPKGVSNAKLWADDAAEVYAEPGADPDKLRGKLWWASASASMTVAYCLAMIVSAAGLAKDATHSAFAWVGGLAVLSLTALAFWKLGRAAGGAFLADRARAT